MTRTVTAWNCLACGVHCERKPTRGQVPKWCDDCRARGARKRVQCGHCGADCWTWSRGRFCSRRCASAAQMKPKQVKSTEPREPVDRRGDLRRGFEDGDPDLFFAALRSASDTTGDCWVWPRLREGYPIFRIGRREVALHRAVLEVKHGAPLGSQHAHHICANSTCVNPVHLQPVTHRENVAEMLARQSYLARIDELEQALRKVAPDHPLLASIPVA